MLNLPKLLLNRTLAQSDLFRCYCIKATKFKPNTNRPYNKLILNPCGQPTTASHPHLLKVGEVTPSIQRIEFQERRQNLVEAIGAHSIKCNTDVKQHVIIIPSASKQYMSDKIPYVFRQNTDFLYLTGCLQPDCCLVLTTADSPSQHYVTLFLPENDDHAEMWDGPRTKLDDAVTLFGVDQALPIKALKHYLLFCTKNSTKLWYDFMTPIQKSLHDTMQGLLNDKINNMWESPVSFIHQLRLIKSPAEISLMQRSCDIASDAISKTIRFAKAGVSEHQIFANIEYECKMNGAEYLAYPPVVAGGTRANIIHYINNNQIVNNGEMVLMDAGCEYHGYSSDITRTWPISGKFNPQQRAVYEGLLDIQRELLRLLHDLPTLDNLFQSMCLLLGKQIQEVGLISRQSSSSQLMKAAYEFCPHHVSHYLGMDVHDTPTVSRAIKLRPGMIITVEPGIYIRESHQVPKEFQGMGFRIEDDILITDKGPVVLTRKCPRTLQDIEELASKNQN